MAPDTSNEPFDFLELAQLWWAEYEDSAITKEHFLSLLAEDIVSGLFFTVHPRNTVEEYDTNAEPFFGKPLLTPEQKAEQRSVLACHPELLI